MQDRLTVNEKEFVVKSLLGKGKGGYSYLVADEKGEYVLKQIHHEPCDYYQFGNKLEAEERDYKRLLQSGIPIPRMIDIDRKNERILKEYIKGDTIYQCVLQDQMKPDYYKQIKEISKRAYEHTLNIDYFPTNFIVQEERLWYIDYECNAYMEEWNYENWGSKYWSKTESFVKYYEKQRENTP